MEERYIAAIDLGSSKIRLTVAKINGNDIQIQYYRETPSDGIRNSAVFNPKKASEPVKKLIDDAEKELNIKILQAVVGLPRCDVRQENNSAKAIRSVPDDSITESEVEELKSIAQDDYPNIDLDKETLYGAVAQSFDCDDNFQIVESEIVGMVSREFTGNFKLFIGKKSSEKAIDKVFNNIEIAVAKKVFTPDSLAKAVLTGDEKESGVALIDFGGGATSVTIYKGKLLRHYACIPFGGKAVTRDIKNECTISEDLAENIKLAYGACMPDRLQTLSEKILQIEGEEGMTGPKQIPVKYLSELITSREKEIVDAMLYEIQESGLADALRSGIVITGGGAEMANLVSFIKECSGYDVRLGYPRHLFSISGCPEAGTAAAATSLGMILSAKADRNLNCIDPAERESAPDSFAAEGNGTAEASDDEGTVQSEGQTEAERQSGTKGQEEVSGQTAEGGNAVDGNSAGANEEDLPDGQLPLGGTEEGNTNPSGKTANSGKAAKAKKPKKSGGLKVTWQKVMEKVNKMYNDIDNENV